MISNSTDLKEIRKFGFIASIFFGSLLSVCIWLNKPIAPYIFGLLTILGFGFLIVPVSMTPVYTTWLRIAHFIGRVITMIILSLVFYFVITPAGIIKRLFGGLPLPTKPNRKAGTYWVERKEPVQPKERFIKRF